MSEFKIDELFDNIEMFTSVDELPISNRLRNAILRIDCVTVGEVIAWCDDYRKKCPGAYDDRCAVLSVVENIGKSSVAEWNETVWWPLEKRLRERRAENVA